MIMSGFSFLKRPFVYGLLVLRILDVPSLGTSGLDTASLLNTLKSKPPIKRYTFFRGLN